MFDSLKVHTMYLKNKLLKHRESTRKCSSFASPKESERAFALHIIQVKAENNDYNILAFCIHVYSFMFLWFNMPLWVFLFITFFILLFIAVVVQAPSSAWQPPLVACCGQKVACQKPFMHHIVNDKYDI